VLGFVAAPIGAMLLVVVVGTASEYNAQYN
jgi:hypothetical protein